LGRGKINIPQKTREKHDGKRDIDGNHRKGRLEEEAKSMKP